MPILKNKTQKQYVNVDMQIFHDKDLKLIDRGMITTLLSLPDNWNFTIRGLEKIIPDKKSAISASLKRIEKKGYLTKRQSRGKNGYYDNVELEIHQIPVVQQMAEKRYPENRDTVNPDTEKRNPAKQSQSNNHISNNHLFKESERSKNSLSEEEYILLVEEFGEENVRYQLEKIEKKNYANCRNYTTLKQWCSDYQINVPRPQKSDKGMELLQTQYDFAELERELLANNSDKRGDIE